MTTEEVLELIKSFDLEHFRRIPDPELFGSYCHLAACFLMADLKVAGKEKGWKWVSGYITNGGRHNHHSWLEYQGTVVDEVGGVIRVMDKDEFYSRYGLKVTARRKPKHALRYAKDCGVSA